MNNLFSQLVGIINAVERSKITMSGPDKKSACIRYMKSYVEGIKKEYPDTYALYNQFIDDYLDDCIDLIIFLVKNKKMVKLFKSNCGCLDGVFGKKGDKADNVVDKILDGEN